MTEKELVELRKRFEPPRMFDIEPPSMYTNWISEREAKNLLDHIDFQAKLIHDLVAEKFDVNNLKAVYEAMDDAGRDRFWDAILRLSLRETIIEAVP